MKDGVTIPIRPVNLALTAQTSILHLLPQGGFKAFSIAPQESTILEEGIDENYEPTEAEIVEYAQWLGMTFPEDDDLRWGHR